MANEDIPLTQARQLMASHLPEYRPFALQEIVRAAKLRGGADQRNMPVANPLNVPAWLDIFLYCALAFITSAAIFMGLYATLVRPHRQSDPDPDDDDGYDNTAMLQQQQQLPVPHAAPRAARSQTYPDKTRGGKREQLAHATGPQRKPPHPPPPMIPVSG